MKRLILLSIMMLPFMAMAQLPHFSKIVDKYSESEGVTAMTVNKQMIEMFAGDNKDFDFVDEVQILLSENTETAKSIVDDAKKAVKKSKVEVLVSANEDGATFTIYTNKRDDIITHLVIIVENDSPSGFIVITGQITEDKIKEVVKIVNM